MNTLNYKKIQVCSFIVTLFALFASFYLQYILGLSPCPLCLMQRLCLCFLLVLIGLSFWRLNRSPSIGVLQIIISAAGLFFALRQLWLQTLPASQVPACMPGLDILVRYFPWKTIARTLFLGTGECAEVHWYFLGISLPGWCAVYFSGMLCLSCFLFWCFYSDKPSS